MAKMLWFGDIADWGVLCPGGNCCIYDSFFLRIIERYFDEGVDYFSEFWRFLFTLWSAGVGFCRVSRQNSVEKHTLEVAGTAFCRENLAKYSAVAASVNPINT